MSLLQIFKERENKCLPECVQSYFSPSNKCNEMLGPSSIELELRIMP